MSLSTFGIAVSLYLIFLTWGFVLCLWLGARLWRIPGATLRKALITGAITLAMQILLLTAIFGVAAVFPAIQKTFSFPAIVALMISLLIINLFVIRRVYATSIWRAIGLLLTASIASALPTSAFQQAFRHYFVETFAISSGSMAPTLQGPHTEVHCKNCDYTFDLAYHDRITVGDGAVRADCPMCRQTWALRATAQKISGDRMLSDKTNVRPRRWDLAVFTPPDNPNTTHVSRVVGLPNESIEILSGEIFTGGQLVRKPLLGHDDLWIEVHDSDFVPKQLRADSPAWQPDAESKIANLRHPELTNVLEFHGPISSTLAYNVDSQFDPTAPVSDIKLACTLENLADGAIVAFEWTFADRRVTAKLVHGGHATLTVSLLDTTGAEVASAEAQQDAPGDWIENADPLLFVIRDGTAALAQGEQIFVELDLLSVGPAMIDSLKEPAPGSGKLLAMLNQADARFARLVLHRDIYYLSLGEFNQQFSHVTFPLQLSDDQYFVLGDNSSRSKDSRFYGPVPAENIHGVTRWIYWPAKRSRFFY